METEPLLYWAGALYFCTLNYSEQKRGDWSPIQGEGTEPPSLLSPPGPGLCKAVFCVTLWRQSCHHGRMNYKDTKLYMSAFLSVDLLTDFAAFCSTDFIDWRYIHSWFVFPPSLWTVAPMDEGTIWYLCTVAPLLYLLFDLLPPPPLPNVQYTQTVYDCGGCWNVLCTVFCRSFTLCFRPDSEPTKLLYHPKQKWPVKTTLRGWCL